MNNTISTESFTQGFSFSYSGQAENSPGTPTRNSNVEVAAEDNSADRRTQNRPRQLQREVLSGQRRELRNRGKQLLNARFFHGGLENGPRDSDSPSLNALIVAGSEDGANDLEFRLLNVTPTGQAREIYSSKSLDAIEEQLQSTGLDLRGMVMDREI